ncbi:hypothetical protein E1A91_A05G282100v1 [Gossypium mustelinum]|uniref:MADS-box domain-containing protein n=1 Tax=Gossypium mustelinum TaxID=34275 RepID=A0A5D2ZCY5_GOSMU|nr:hypothetical protein E1A91_A05G282100v1 [Gossypium mustelinum]
MGRKATVYELISNEYARKTTLKKRKAGLLKKLSELTTLCGVAACAIIFSSYDAQPDVWPSKAEACQVLKKFKSSPAQQRGKNMMDQTKRKKKNRELEKELALAETMAGENNCDWNNLEQLKELDYQLQENIKLITDKIKS